jgi:anti-sigma regulatory factor (Ser/Thr protein kinase)
MRELALHLLDVAENSVSAGASIVQVAVLEDTRQDRLKLVVQDDGKGMDPEILSQVTDPFFTSRKTRKVGLGLPLLKEAAEACNGGLTIQSEPGKGTLVEVEFQRGHIDRMPLGDLSATFLTLLVSAPHIRWLFKHGLDGTQCVLDSQPIIEALGDVSITEPSVLAFLREYIQQAFAEIEASQANPA